jgi:periplasmic protein TonB
MPRGFIIALCLSAAAHLAAAAVMLAPAIPVHVASDPAIQIQLVRPAITAVAHRAAAPEPVTPPTPEAGSARDQVPPTAKATLPRRVATTAPPAPRPVPVQQVAHTATGAEPPKAIHTIDSAATSDALRQQVGQLLSQHFHYPRLARSRGWEGIVELGLHIAADGRVSKVILHRSSTYPTLDRAALMAAGHVRRVPGAEVLLNQEGMNLVVPVHYRLIDS